MTLNSIIMKISFFFVCISYPVHIFLLTYINWDNPKYVKKWSIIMKGFKKHSKVARLLPNLFILRKMLFAIFFMPGWNLNSQIVLVCPLALIQILITVMLFNSWPYKMRIVNFCEFCSNMILLIII